jgi:hypothetical protein
MSSKQGLNKGNVGGKPLFKGLELVLRDYIQGVSSRTPIPYKFRNALIEL